MPGTGGDLLRGKQTQESAGACQSGKANTGERRRMHERAERRSGRASQHPIAERWVALQEPTADRALEAQPSCAEDGLRPRMSLKRLSGANRWQEPKNNRHTSGDT